MMSGELEASCGCYELGFETHAIGFEFDNNPPHHPFLEPFSRFFRENTTKHAL
jgi:hypothetical protein